MPLNSKLVRWRSGRSTTAPLLPQAFVDTTMPDLTGYVTKTVKSSGGDFTSLNTAVNHTSVKNATTGIIVQVDAGLTLAERVVLPIHTNPWVVIRSSGHASLPVNTRVTPGDVSDMFTITAAASPLVCVETAESAHHYRFIGMQAKPPTSGFCNTLVQLGDGYETVLPQLPHHITIDRSYLHGDPTLGCRRGIAAQAYHVGVIDSHIADIKEDGADSQCLNSFKSPGPFRIVNNYLEAAGENIMFGGADSSIEAAVPADIEILRNHFFKPYTWKIGHGTYQGTPWTVKNHLELKDAWRVLIEGNLFENCWAHAQNGNSVLITVVHQSGNAPWTRCTDVTFQHNHAKSVGQGINFQGYDSYNGSVQGVRARIYNNLLEDVGTVTDDNGYFIQMIRAHDVTVEHNTAIVRQKIISIAANNNQRFAMRHNIVAFGTNGIHSDTAVGTAALNTYMPAPYDVSGNVFYGGASEEASYPPENFWPATVAAVGFEDFGGADYRLAVGSPYKDAAPGGIDIGCDIDLMIANM